MGANRKVWIVLLATLSLVFTACGGGQSSTTAVTSGVLVWDKSFDIKTIDPGRANEVTGYAVIKALYDTLLTFRGSDLSKPAPLLAQSYEVSPDAKTFTFHLRADAKFADGKAVTAGDAAFSFMRLKNIQGIPSFRMNGLTATATDPATLTITSSIPNPAVPALLTGPSFAVLEAAVVRAHGGTDGADAKTADTAQSFLDSQSAGSGPYVLDSFDVTSRVSVKANTHYWGSPKPGYAQIILRNVPPEAQVLNVQKGESQLAIDLSPDQVANIDTSHTNVLQAPSITVFFLFATESPSVSKAASNPDFQQAIRLGLDYPGILGIVGKGAVQSAGVMPIQLPGHLDATAAPKRDLAGAKIALAKSGVSNPSVTLEYATDFTINGVSFATLAQKIQADLKEVGITVTLTPGPLTTTLANWRAGKEQLGLWTTTGLPDPSQALIFCPGGVESLRAVWKIGMNTALDDKCTQASTAVGDSQRASAYLAMQQELNQEGPYFPLFQPAQVLISAKSVKNLSYSPGWLVDLATIGHS
jgi:peptide/nickel transport system substrate-binding protein